MNTMNVATSMKTMLDLLTRLVEMRYCYERVKDNPQLTEGEKCAAWCLKNLVRDCLPGPVLVTYDRMKETEAELHECPEVFAMAVLVSTYRRASPAKRRKLLAHFAGHAPAALGRQRTDPVKSRKSRSPKLRRRHIESANH